jgi:hypothetical protein
MRERTESRSWRGLQHSRLDVGAAQGLLFLRDLGRQALGLTPAVPRCLSDLGASLQQAVIRFLNVPQGRGRVGRGEWSSQGCDRDQDQAESKDSQRLDQRAPEGHGVLVGSGRG